MATVKYYLREGLLPPGVRTAPNQADYDERHVHRLRLIRVLREVADLPIATMKRVLDAVSDESLSTHGLLGTTHHALGPHEETPDDDRFAAAMAQVDDYLQRLGWQVSAQAPARATLARALASLWRLGHHVDATVFSEYARAADSIAAWEVQRTAEATSRADLVEQVVVGTLIYEAALVALRRLAQEHHSATRFGP